MVQWFGLHVPSAGGTGSIPGQGTNTPHGMTKKFIYFLINKKNVKTILNFRAIQKQTYRL